MFWFGLIYLALNLKDVYHFYDTFYFSVVTQLTIGYGDIQPLGAAKVVAGVQATVGWALTLLVLARFVSFLPRILDETTDDISEDISSNSRDDNGED